VVWRSSASWSSPGVRARPDHGRRADERAAARDAFSEATSLSRSARDRGPRACRLARGTTGRSREGATESRGNRVKVQQGRVAITAQADE